MQLFAICSVAKSKCAVEKGPACTKKCRDPSKNDDFCAENQVFCAVVNPA